MTTRTARRIFNFVGHIVFDDYGANGLNLSTKCQVDLWYSRHLSRAYMTYKNFEILTDTQTPDVPPGPTLSKVDPDSPVHGFCALAW